MDGFEELRKIQNVMEWGLFPCLPETNWAFSLQEFGTTHIRWNVAGFEFGENAHSL